MPKGKKAEAIKEVKSEKSKVKSTRYEGKRSASFIPSKKLKTGKTTKEKKSVKTTENIVDQNAEMQTVPTVKTSNAELKTRTVNADLKIDVLNTEGKTVGSITLPKNIFGAKINPQLMAQAVRIYLVNQRRGTVSTKTRGEVDGSTRKIYRQKGTGRARHGGIRAPIFVKGGIAHGPKPKDYALHLPKNMKRAALLSALSAKVKDQQIAIVDGLESLERKTKFVAKAFDNWGLLRKERNTLLILPIDMQDIYRITRNLAGVTITSADRVNTYEILQHKTIVLMKDAIESLEKTFLNKKSEYQNPKSETNSKSK